MKGRFFILGYCFHLYLVVFNMQFIANEIKWSILIPTLKARKHLLARVHTEISNQIQAAGLDNRIEILLFEDNREHTVGYKRNWLLNNAKGEYVCFLDDDDMVSDDYIKLIYSKLLTNPDCVGLEGIITSDGKNAHKFIHSIKYHDWFFENDIYYRPPNHLNPIKRSIAIQFKFPEINSGEDKAWSMAIEKSGLLKVEAPVSKPYYYYIYITNK